MPIGHDNLVAAPRQHTLVIRELAIDQLGGEGEVAGGGANVVCTQYDIDQVIRFAEKTGQFKNALTRHDQLIALLIVDVRINGAHRHAMTVGCYRTQLALIDLQQQTVQIVAHVLLSHGKAGALNQAAQLALTDGKTHGTRAVFNIGEIVRRQGCQGKAATPGLDQCLAVFNLEVQRGIVRQRFADIHQLAGRNGNLPVFAGFVQCDTANQLDFQVGTGQ